MGDEGFSSRWLFSESEIVPRQKLVRQSNGSLDEKVRNWREFSRKELMEHVERVVQVNSSQVCEGWQV